MCITITVAEAAPDEAVCRVVALMKLLQQSDTNFRGLVIQVSRGPWTQVAVDDDGEAMRGRLLCVLLDELLRGGPDSFIGTLCGDRAAELAPPALPFRLAAHPKWMGRKTLVHRAIPTNPAEHGLAEQHSWQVAQRPA